MTKELEKSKEEALWGMFVADALSMPVHWYYNPDDIKHGYGGWLTGYRVPEKQHPSSILTLSSIGWYFDIIIYRLVFGHCHLQVGILTLSSTGWYFDIGIYKLVFGHCHLQVGILTLSSTGWYFDIVI